MITANLKIMEKAIRLFLESVAANVRNDIEWFNRQLEKEREERKIIYDKALLEYNLLSNDNIQKRMV